MTSDASQSINKIEYSRQTLLSLRIRPSRPPIEKSTYNRLIKDCGILKPFRGCRAGKVILSRKDGVLLNIPTRITNREISIPRPQRSRCLVNNRCDRNYPNVIPLKRVAQPHPPSKKTLAFANFNARSLRNKSEIFIDHCIDSKIDVCAVTETWLREELPLHPKVISSKMSHEPRIYRRGLEVAPGFCSGIILR